jgi:Apea-like HEPN
MFSQFGVHIRNLDGEQQRCLIVATRRYVNSFGEEDPVDRYCDLWESSELLVKGLKQPDGRRIKGNVTAKIAYAVAQQTGLSRKRLNTAIDNLYDIRNDVVHSAVEEPLKLEEMTRYLELVTDQTLRFSLGLPPASCIEIAGFVTKYGA